jgi:hypothetical protein
MTALLALFMILMLGCPTETEDQEPPREGTGLSFEIGGHKGITDPNTDPVTITVTVPSTVNLSEAERILTLSPGATSSSTPAEPVFPGTATYTVTAESGATQTYQVVVIQTGGTSIGFSDAGDRALLSPTPLEVYKNDPVKTYMTFNSMWGHAANDPELFVFTLDTGTIGEGGILSNTIWNGKTPRGLARLEFKADGETVTGTFGDDAPNDFPYTLDGTVGGTVGYGVGPFSIRQGSTFLAAQGGFDTYQWLVDNESKGTGRVLVLHPEDYAVGTHKLTLVLTREGVAYSKKADLVVAQTRPQN